MAKILEKCNCGCKELTNNSSKYCIGHWTRQNWIRIKCAHKKEEHPLWIGGKPICIDCEKQLACYDAQRCRKCAKQGELHSNYIDGRSWEKYPKIFNANLREEIKKRDNYECQGKDCSITQEEHILIYDRDIEIHHIDYDRKNCNKDNLITLCKQCNIRANYNRDYWREYFRVKNNIQRPIYPS